MPIPWFYRLSFKGDVKMKKLIVLSLFFPVMALAQGGRLFNVIYSTLIDGTIQLNISTTIPNRSYQHAGITIPNGYSFVNNSCSNQQGQTCVFAVSNTSPVQLIISGSSGVINNTLCLNQNEQLNCERSAIQYLTNSVVSGGLSGNNSVGVIYSGVNNSNWSVYSPTDFANVQFKASFCSNDGLFCLASGFEGSSNSDYVPAVFYSEDKGLSWIPADVSQMVTAYRGSISSPIQVWAMSCIAATGYCIAGGQASLSSSDVSYLWYSMDFGNSWSIAYQQPSSSVFRNYATSCYQSNTLNKDKCIVVGANTNNNGITVGSGIASQIPMVLTNAVIAPPSNYLNVPAGATCSSNDHCVLVGYLMNSLNTQIQTSVIYYSDDGGQNWDQSNIATLGPNAPPVINLSDVSCDASGQKCVAAGWYSTSSELRTPAYGLVYVSNDGGVSWNKTIFLEPSSVDSNVNRMNAVKCAPYSGVCTVSGHGGNSASGTTFPVSYISYDYGQTWSKASVMPLPSGTTGNVFSVSLFEEIKLF